jgi:ribosomal-protein-serine acetyltransferase
MTHTIKVNPDISLHRINYSDAESVFRLIDHHRERLRKWLPFVDITHSVKNTEAFIESLFNPCSREMVFTVRFKNEVVGLIGYKDIDRNNKKIELGYWIAPNHEGKGIVTLSVKALISAAFGKMGMNRIQICCAIGNKRSIKIPKRLNFRLEGILRHGEFLNGKFVDLELYSLLKNEWHEGNELNNG